MMNQSKDIKHLYIHIPFCKSICFYCDFTHRIYNQDLVNKWLSNLEKEIKSKNINNNIETIYLGGGTPSCLNVTELEAIFKLIEPYSKSVKEFTIEVNPETITKEKVDLFVKYGVNRISMGIQSFDENILKSLNRKHTKHDVLKCLEIFKEKGINNISCDLMYSLPSQTIDSFLSDINELITLKIPHISFYSLTIGENTVFGKKGIKPLNEEIEADMYEKANKLLIDNNYDQYEISNYCLNNLKSKHNLGYWFYDDFYGISIGASGKENHQRYENSSNFNKYLEGNFNKEIINLSKEDEMFENLMMSLRLKEGLDLDLFERRYNVSIFDVYQDKLDKAIKNGYLTIINNHLVCLKREILNTILVDFL